MFTDQNAKLCVLTIQFVKTFPSHTRFNPI